MRIAGYVRQATGLSDPDTAFAQGERVRRWARDTGNDLIAVCQDDHTAASPTERPGFKALLDIVRAGDIDAVVVANLAAFSADKVAQEIMISDIRRTGTTVIATDEADLEVLRSGAEDHTRMVVRDIVERVGEYRDAYGLSGDEAPTVSAMPPEANGSTDSNPTTDVVVELIAPTG